MKKLENCGLNEYYDLKKLMEQNHPLITQNEKFLGEFIHQLDKLNKLNNFDSIIKKTKEKEKLCSTFSEIKAMSLLMDKLDKPSDLVIIPESSSPSPDFKIRKCNINITIEVKMIQDKFSNDKLMKNKTIIKLPIGLRNVYEIDDIPTILNAITKSITRKQYYNNIPYIIIFDCENTTIEEDEFEDILYPQKDKEFSKHDGLFYKCLSKDFKYHMISGVAAIFGKRLTFFENPNTSEKIPTSIIKLLGFRIYKP